MDAGDILAMKQYLAWLVQAPEHMPHLSDGQVSELLWQRHPRRRFIKQVAKGACLLDIGAGSGGLAAWKEGEPRRADIRLFGVDQRMGEHAALYEAWEVVNLDTGKPRFPGIRFDAFYASHLIEHLASPDDLVQYMACVANERAEVYFEWPSPKTQFFPTSVAFEHETGLHVLPLNFFDDHTHKATFDIGTVSAMLARSGFETVESGEIDLGEIAIEHMARGKRLGGGWFGTGLWSIVGWASYVHAQRRGDTASIGG
jgi:hypothetical protein